jgi:plastocyanin
MNRFFTLPAVVVALAASTAPASAGVSVAGTGEPLFTNSTQNTQWVSWQAPQSVEAYRLRIRYYRDNVEVGSPVVVPTGLSGTAWMDWDGVATLEEGKTYAICATGEYRFPNDSIWFADGQSSCSTGALEGKRTYTTIDRTPPTVSATLAGGAAATSQTSIPLAVAFQDAQAGPFPANFVCIQAGTDPCTNGFAYSAACSSPAGPDKNTSFACQVDVPALPDGPVTVCVKAADAAVPNNPSSSNQTGSASAANISAAACDTVVLDRTAPAVELGASTLTPTAGDAVAFTASASDSGSGLSGTPRWTWGDGTAGGSGGAVSHTFASAGTYEVEARVTDAAGNEKVAKKTVVVSAPPAAPSDPADPGETPPQDPQPGDGTTTPPPSDPADSEKPPLEPRTLELRAPKRFRLGTSRRLVLGVATERAGRLSLTLVRRGRVIAGVDAKVKPGLALRKLLLPRKLRAGRYAVKALFTPAGASAAEARRATIRFVKRR